MSIFKEVRKEIMSNKAAREDGKDLCVPWNKFPKLSQVLPGVQRARYYIITSGPKAGKTQLTDNLFVLEPVHYLLEKPNTNLKIKIYYFTLEMSAKDKITQLISNKVYHETGQIIKPEDLQSLFKGYILDDEIATFLHDKKYEDWFDFLENTVTFIDHIRNPTGIWVYMREIARQNGKFYYKGVQIPTPPGVNWSSIIYDEYRPNDPNLITVAVTDHVGLLSPEEGAPTLGEAINRFSGYCIKMRNMFEQTPVNVQQQALQTEAATQHQGKTVVSKVKPTHSGLGDAKLPSRDCDIMIGLFNPSRFEIPIYPEKVGYDIKRFGDHYRELSIILNRRGGGNIDLDLYFHGGVNEFAELPDPSRFKKNPELYVNYNL